MLDTCFIGIPHASAEEAKEPEATAVAEAETKPSEGDAKAETQAL